VPGVSKVNVFGTKGAIRIKTDPRALWARKISVDDLAAAIRLGTSYSGAGQLDSPSGTTVLQPKGQLDTPEEYASLIVGNVDGSPVYLRDVAQVRESVENERMNMRFWVRGYPVPSSTVVVAVNRQAGANAVEVSRAIRDVLPIIQTEIRVRADHADLRPVPVDRPLGRRRQFTLLSRSCSSSRSSSSSSAAPGTPSSRRWRSRCLFS
jgi:HAE1 family hydrophobic/amphiphilic exporter-1